MSVWEVKDKDGKVEYAVIEISGHLGDTNITSVEFLYKEARKGSSHDLKSKFVTNLPLTVAMNTQGVYSKEELKEKLTEIKELAEKKAKGIAEALAHL